LSPLSWTKERGTWEYTPPTPEEEAYWRERHRVDARCREAAALRHARTQGAEVEREKWQGVVAEKDAALNEKDAVFAEQAALIAELQAKLEGRS